MKCKTCKHWKHEFVSVGRCSGITASTVVIPIPNQPKGKPDAKLIVKPGIITDASFVKTFADFHCGNWRRRSPS